MHNLKKIICLAVIISFMGVTSSYSEDLAPDVNIVSKTSPTAHDLCSITGKVVNIQKKTDNPWPDAPNIFTSEFKEIAINITSSKSLNKEEAEKNRCSQIKKGTVKRYRICSKAYLRKGDEIKGNESSSIGLSKNVAHCLFDIKVKRSKRTN